MGGKRHGRPGLASGTGFAYLSRDIRGGSSQEEGYPDPAMARATRKYDFLSYNRYDVLRPNWLFWVVSLFLSRHLLLLILLGVSHGKSGGGPPNPAVGALLDPLFFVSDIPALLLLATLGARLPSGGKAARFLWRNGRFLLLGSCALYLGLLFWQLGPDVAGYHPIGWGMIALTVLVAAVLLRSPYLRDMFAGFPEAESRTASRE